MGNYGQGQVPTNPLMGGLKVKPSQKPAITGQVPGNAQLNNDRAIAEGNIRQKIQDQWQPTGGVPQPMVNVMPNTQPGGGFQMDGGEQDRLRKLYQNQLQGRTMPGTPDGTGIPFDLGGPMKPPPQDGSWQPGGPRTPKPPIGGGKGGGGNWPPSGPGPVYPPPGGGGKGGGQPTGPITQPQLPPQGGGKGGGQPTGPMYPPRRPGMPPPKPGDPDFVGRI